jgi:RNA polymerase sigma factor (sigma-70 family)
MSERGTRSLRERDASFDEFVGNSTARLYRTARLLAGATAEADAADLVQETLIVLYRKWTSLSDPEAAGAYAYTTLYRLTTRHRRRLERRRERQVPLPDECVEDNYRDDSVSQALGALPIGQRETLVLRFYSDLSVVDTANAMRCSESTVKSQSAKGLASLRKILERANERT